MLPALTHAQSPITNISNQIVSLLPQLMSPHWLIVIQSPESTLGFTLSVGHSVGVDKWSLPNSKILFNCLIDADIYMSSEHLKLHVAHTACHHPRTTPPEVSHLSDSTGVGQSWRHATPLLLRVHMVNQKSSPALSSNMSEIWGLLSIVFL